MIATRVNQIREVTRIAQNKFETAIAISDTRASEELARILDTLCEICKREEKYGN